MNTYRLGVTTDSTTGKQYFEADADKPAGAIAAALENIKPAENVVIDCHLLRENVGKDNTGDFRVLNGKARSL